MEGDKWYLLRRCSQPTKHFLATSPLEIGRNITAFIVCSCLHVSKNHATITCQNNNLVYLRDNKTTNGTYVNGERIEPERFCLLLECDVISFGKPEDVMEDLDSEYCFQLLLEKQTVTDINANEVLNRTLQYLENLIEHQLVELHSLAEYSRDENIAEDLDDSHSDRITSQHIRDIEQQLEVIHSSNVPDFVQTPTGSIMPPGLSQQKPPPKSPAAASVQDQYAITDNSRSTTFEHIAVQEPSLSTNGNVAQVKKVKPSPKSKKLSEFSQLAPQLESPNVSNINDNSTTVPEISRTIKLESVELNEPISSTDKDSSQVKEVQPIPNPVKPPNPPQVESPVIINNSNSVPENSKSGYSIPESFELLKPSSPTNSGTSQSSKDKESKSKKPKNAVLKESNKEDNQDTIEKHPSRSKKPQTVSEKDLSPRNSSKKRTSQSEIYESSSKAKKPKKVPEKEPTASNSKRTSQPVIDDGPSKAKKLKHTVSEQKPSDSKIKDATVTNNSFSKPKKSKFPEKEASVSNTKRTSLPVSLDKSSSKAQKTKNPRDQNPSDFSSKRTSKCEISDGSSKGKKPKDVPDKDTSVSKTRCTSIEKSSSKTKTPKKDSSDSKTKHTLKSVIDDSHSKAKKVKNIPEKEPSTSKSRHSSQSVKDTSSFKAVKSKNTGPSDSNSRRTSQPDESLTSMEPKRSKEARSSSVFKITDGNSNKEKCNLVTAIVTPEGDSLMDRVKRRPRSMSMAMHVFDNSNRRQSILIDPLPSVTRRSSRIKAKLDTSSEKSPNKLPRDSNKLPLRHRSKSMIATDRNPKHSKTNEKPTTKKNNDPFEALKEMRPKILSQFSFLPPPLESTVERLSKLVRPRSYSMLDLATSSTEEASEPSESRVPMQTCPPGILKRPSTDHRITLKMRPRSYSIVERSVTFAPDISISHFDQNGKTSQFTTGGESSHSPKKSVKYGRSYSTVGFASATSPTQSAQSAPTDIWKKRDDPRHRSSIAAHLLNVLNQADSTTRPTSTYDSMGTLDTSKTSNRSKPRSHSTYGRIIDPNPESKDTAEQTTRSTNACETLATASSNCKKPISRSSTMCGTITNGKLILEPQSRRNILNNQSPRTPSPSGQSSGPGSTVTRIALERSNSYLGNVDGNQNIRQDRGSRKSILGHTYDGDRRISMYVPKAPTEDSLPEHHKTFLSHIIRWNPAWLEEYMMHDTLPPIFHETKTDIPVMMYTYKNFEVYSDTQICLVILEVWEATFAAYKETKEKNDLEFALWSNPPKAFTGTKITKVTLKINSKNILCNGTRSVSYGMLLLVKFPDLHKCSNHWFLAMIDDTEYKNLANGGRDLLVSIYVKLDPWQIASLGPNAVAKVKLLNSIKNELAMVRAVYELQTSKLHDQIVSPRVNHFRKFTNLSPMQWKHDLNPSQLKAVSQCICALTSAIPGIQIIQGPPGTGKSRVIVSIVMEYLQRTIRYNRGKVLLCAQTNVAIDEIVLRLLEAREKMSGSKKFSMVRVGRCESMHPKALEISSTEMAKKFDNYPDIKHQIGVLRKQIEKYSYRHDSVGPQAAYFKVQYQHYTKKLEDLVSFHSSPNTLYHEEMAIIEKADVIATTLQGCSLTKMQGLKNKITFCIVDEAAKATEPEVLIPLSLGVNNLVMVGDQQQLAAFVMSQHAKKHGLSESLFSRLIHCCEFSENSCMLPLSIQYRMHPDIAHFPNLAFYEGGLQNGLGALLASGLPPYRVVEVRGRSGDQDESGANADEAKMVARLALAIDTHMREKELDLTICVLTPYTAQREAIQHKLRNLTTRRIEVSTVDSFQGQERDVVVVSCARSSGIGFLDDPGRMSVLLTRAKKSCIVCCNPEALREHSLWAALISDAESRHMARPLPLNMPPYINEEDNCKRFMAYLQ